MQIIAAVFGLLGIWLVGRKSRIGFICFAVSNMAMICFSFNHGYWWMFVQFIVFNIMAIKFFIDWR